MFINIVDPDFEFTNNLIFVILWFLLMAWTLKKNIEVIKQKEPLLILYEEGFVYHYGDHDSGFITWGEIELAGLQMFEQGEALIIKKKNTLDVFEIKGISKFKQLLLYPGQYSITTSMVKGNIVEILHALKVNKKMHYMPLFNKNKKWMLKVTKENYYQKMNSYMKKTKKGRVWTRLKEEQLDLVLVYNFEKALIEKGLIEYLNSSDLYLLWAVIQSLEKMKSNELLTIAKLINSLDSLDDHNLVISDITSQFKSIKENSMLLGLAYLEQFK